MSIARCVEDAVAEEGHATVGRRRGVAAASRKYPVTPDLTAGLRIECANLTGRGHIHNALRDNGCRLQSGSIERMHPLQLQAADVRCVDLIQRAISIAAGNPVIGWPLALL